MSFPNELDAFRAFARIYPETCVLLVDTYDTIESGVPNAIQTFKEMRARGLKTRAAIRLDSGDLARLSKIAHRMMREAGFDDPLIVGSNDLDEDLIADLKRQGAKINAWGVGTHLITASDSPALSGVYKLVAISDNGAWQPRIKISSNLSKATNPGRKQIVRYFDPNDTPLGDVLYDMDEPFPHNGTIHGRDAIQPHRESRLRNTARAEPLFETVFEKGVRTKPQPPIRDVRARYLAQRAMLPDEYKRLRNPEIYRVILSPSIGELKEDLLKNPDG
jgi:nicotinate phosphoribosyltransferase